MKTYQCREKIVLLVEPKSVLQVKAGAVLEQLDFQGVNRPLLRILGPGSLLLRGALLPSNLSHLGAPTAIHLRGTQLDYFNLDSLEELHKYYRQALDSAYLQMAIVIRQAIAHRLIYQLVQLAHQLGQVRRDHWVDLPVHLTIEEWAECIGTSRANAALLLRSLRRKQVLSIKNQVLSIDLINLASVVS